MVAGFRGLIGSAWVRLTAGVCALLCLAAAVQDQPAADGVAGVRFGGDHAQTRVVIELGRSAKGRLIEDGSDGRSVVLALPGVSVPADRRGRGGGLVSAWSLDSAAGAARLRLQLAGPGQVRRRFLLPPSDGVNVYRYVIDIGAGAASPPQAEPAAASGRPARAAAAGVTPVADTAPPSSRQRMVIVIDAGHGGHDPGALGAGSREKDVNLAAARALRAKLLATGRYRVVMTRDSDVFVPLAARVGIARQANADLFISLHSDSGSDAGMRGATVYTLSDKGSDRVARNVMSDSNWFINVNLPSQDKAVNQILLDLTQRATRNHSAAFAEDVLRRIGDRAMARAGHRDAGFVVLLAPDVPAVLLEMGFITNPYDERALNDVGARDRMMGGVADAIDAYFGQRAKLAAR